MSTTVLESTHLENLLSIRAESIEQFFEICNRVIELTEKSGEKLLIVLKKLSELLQHLNNDKKACSKNLLDCKDNLKLLGTFDFSAPNDENRLTQLYLSKNILTYTQNTLALHMMKDKIPSESLEQFEDTQELIKIYLYNMIKQIKRIETKLSSNRYHLFFPEEYNQISSQDDLSPLTLVG